MRQQKFLLIRRELPTLALSHHVKVMNTGKKVINKKLNHRVFVLRPSKRT